MFQLNPATSIRTHGLRPQPPRSRPNPRWELRPPTPRRCAVDLDRVSKSFGHRDRSAVTAIEDVDLRVPEHSIMLIQGPSGSGKTTLLGIIGCMIRPSAGRVTVAGHEMTRLSEDLLAEIRRTHCGFVFQNPHLIHRATVLENVMVPGLTRTHHDGDLRQHALSLLTKLGMAPRSNRRVERLSGGERQRVAIARALINDPRIIIADEPTAHLDSLSAQTFVELMFDLHSQGKTVIVASHDPALCKPELFTKVVKLRNGRIEAG